MELIFENKGIVWSITWELHIDVVACPVTFLRIGRNDGVDSGISFWSNSS
jgi:hypothetical protein